MIQEVSKTGKIECRYWDFRMSSDSRVPKRLLLLVIVPVAPGQCADPVAGNSNTGGRSGADEVPLEYQRGFGPSARIPDQIFRNFDSVLFRCMDSLKGHLVFPPVARRESSLS
jgi:hypothetical protein